MRTFSLLFLTLTTFVTPTTAQTFTVSAPCVNPFGQQFAATPCMDVAYGKPIGDTGVYFFGLVQTTLEEAAGTITYVSLGHTFEVANIQTNLRVGNFRYIQEDYFEWANFYASATYSLDGSGDVWLDTDTYIPIKNSSTLQLTGIGYRTPTFNGVQVQTRLSHVLDDGWTLDTRGTYTLGVAQVYIRRVIGAYRNLSGGISLSL